VSTSEQVHKLVNTVAEFVKGGLESRIATLEAENAQLRSEVEALRGDAERWRTLPAFLEKHQINYIMLLADIDAARKEADRGN
jgi:hypothetical protein